MISLESGTPRVYHAAMTPLRIAVAGTPLTTPKPGGTVKGIAYAASLGIKAMEIEWVQSVPREPRRMAEIRAAAEEHDVSLTVHAPYYVNLNSPEPEKLAASIRRVTDALTMAQLCGAWSVCVHAAFYLKDPPERALDRVRKAVDTILKRKKQQFPDVNLALETMGKHSQFGTVEEVLAISKEFDQFPCLDPAHLHARANGGVNTTAEWDALFDHYTKVLGKKSLQRMHMHYSGIAYTAAGERHHLPFEESDARWKDFLKVLKKRGLGGQLVCESPAMEQDALLLMRTYAKLR